MLVCLRIIKWALGTTLHVPERELEMSDTVRLVRDGHDPVDVLPSQVTPLSIAWIFLVILVYFTFRCVAIGRDSMAVWHHKLYKHRRTCIVHTAFLEPLFSVERLLGLVRSMPCTCM